MSEVEMYYNKLRQHFPQSVDWKHLHPQQQMQFVQAVNVILSTMQNPARFDGFEI